MLKNEQIFFSNTYNKIKKMTDRSNPIIELNGKFWTVKEFTLTELGYLYVKLYSEEDKRFLNYRVSDDFNPKYNFIVDLIKEYERSNLSEILYLREQYL
jgi:hypothetical protein